MFRISKLSRCSTREKRLRTGPKKRLRQLLLKIITVRNSSCRKVMFSQVSVCSQGGGVLGRPPLGRPPLGGRHLPPGKQAPPSWQADIPLWEADTPPAGRHPQEGRHPSADGYCSGRAHPTWMHSCLKKLQDCAPSIKLVLKRLHKSVNLLQNFSIYLHYLPPYFLLKKK